MGKRTNIYFIEEKKRKVNITCEMNLSLEIKEKNNMVKMIKKKNLRKVILYNRVQKSMWVIGLSYTLLLGL